MPIEIHVDDDDAQKTLLKAAHIMADLRGFWPMVVPLFIGWMRQQFDSEGRFASGGWAHLSPDYAAYKAIEYPGKGILVASGKMRQAVSRPHRRVTPNTLTLTIDSSILRYHQTGTDNMPARPVLFGDEHMPGAVRHDLEQAAYAYVDRALKAV